MVQEAVRDAIKNAEENKVPFICQPSYWDPISKVTNCKFFAGKAEDILPNLLRDVDSKEVNTVLCI